MTVPADSGGWKGRGEYGSEEGCTFGEKDEEREGKPAEEDAAGS